MICGKHGPVGMKCCADYMLKTREMVRDRIENRMNENGVKNAEADQFEMVDVDPGLPQF